MWANSHTRARDRRTHPRGPGAFSLIEVTLAIGIVVFALVAILGLLPVAMKSSATNERETQATFIAQNIFSDLASGAAPTNTFIIKGPEVYEPAGLLKINLAAKSVNYLVYNDQGAPLGEATPSEFALPITTTNAIYGAKVSIRQDGSTPNLSQVSVQVEVPLTAPSAARTRYQYATEIRNR